VSEEERKKERGDSTSKGGLGESKAALQCKRIIPKRSQDECGRVDNVERDSDICGVLWVQLQGY